MLLILLEARAEFEVLKFCQLLPPGLNLLTPASVAIQMLLAPSTATALVLLEARPKLAAL